MDDNANVKEAWLTRHHLRQARSTTMDEGDLLPVVQGGQRW